MMPQAHGNRRHWLKLVTTASALMVTGCGFAPRRSTVLAIASIQLDGFERSSTLDDDLRFEIERRGQTRVLPSGAQARLMSLADTKEQSAAASTSAGQVRELSLRRRFKFRVEWSDGRVAIPDTELTLSQSISFDETVVLAKLQEAEGQYRFMQTDMVAQIMRRLASLTPPSDLVMPAAHDLSHANQN